MNEKNAVLTVPNWSFGRNRFLLNRFEEILDRADIRTHFLKGDIDHNRTVSAFSGPFDSVKNALFEMAESAFEAIDLNHHVGVHPRIGALDVCPFIPLWQDEEVQPDWASLEFQMMGLVNRFAEEFSARFEVPTFLYEKSAEVGKVSSLPQLRKEGFGGLMSHEISPDYGPNQIHQRLGATVMGVRDFLIAMNCNIDEEYPEIAKESARRIREARKLGDDRFTGVRALGFALASKGISQLSMNLTAPNRTPIDPIVEWVQTQCRANSVAFAGTELIGVIRPRDMEHCTTVYPKPEQIVDGAK